MQPRLSTTGTSRGGHGSIGSQLYSQCDPANLCLYRSTNHKKKPLAVPPSARHRSPSSAPGPPRRLSRDGLTGRHTAFARITWTRPLSPPYAAQPTSPRATGYTPPAARPSDRPQWPVSPFVLVSPPAGTSRQTGVARHHPYSAPTGRDCLAATPPGNTATYDVAVIRLLLGPHSQTSAFDTCPTETGTGDQAGP
jgi:hypothetical protein